MFLPPNLPDIFKAPFLTLGCQEMNEVRRKVNAACNLQASAKPTGLTIYKDMDAAMNLHRAI